MGPFKVLDETLLHNLKTFKKCSLCVEGKKPSKITDMVSYGWQKKMWNYWFQVKTTMVLAVQY